MGDFNISIDDPDQTPVALDSEGYQGTLLDPGLGEKRLI